VTKQSESKDDHLGTITRVNSLKYRLITGGKGGKKKHFGNSWFLIEARPTALPL